MPTDVSQQRGHETVLDVDAERLARVYAQAFLGAAKSNDDPAGALDDFRAVVAEVLDRFPQFAEAIRSAFLSHEQRLELIDRVLGGRVGPAVLNTLKVMSAHNRLGLLRTVARQAEELFNEDNGQVHVEVTAAETLPAELVGELESALRDRFHFQPILKLAIDPDMIAGVKIRVRDTVYDGSLQTVFAKARQSMVERAIERIEKDPANFLATPPADKGQGGGDPGGGDPGQAS